MAVRSRTLSHAGGGIIRAAGKYGTDVLYAGYPSKYQHQTSFVSPGPPYTVDNPFHQVNSRLIPFRINGVTSPNRYYIWEWENVPVAVRQTDDLTPQPDWIGLETKALSAMDPQKPIVDLPLFLFELRELPRAIRDIGRFLSGYGSGIVKDPGGAYLSWKFGWGPLLSDLSSLLNLAEAMEKRLKALREAKDKEQFSGKLPRDSAAWSSSIETFYGGNSWVQYKKNYSYTEENWFTTNYFLPEGYLPETTDLTGKLRWALGLKASASTIWNAIPWSWLVDYFLNIGDFLEATQGLLRFEARDMCIMSKGVLKVQAELSGWQESRWKEGPFDEGGSATFTHLRRRVVSNPKPRIRFRPFLTDGQALILGALGASRTSTFSRGG